MASAASNVASDPVPLDDTARVQAWCDKQEINELVQRWGLARDQGLWEALAAVYHPDARMTVSWFDGPAVEFVNASRERSGGGMYNKHYLVGTVVDLHGARAIAESNVFMVSQAVVHGIEVNAQGYFRFLDQVERRDGAWRIARRTAVYERDFMAPIDPVASLDLDPTRLASVPKAYRYMGYRFRTSGSKLREGILIGGSSEEAALRAEYATWSGR